MAMYHLATMPLLKTGANRRHHTRLVCWWCRWRQDTRSQTVLEETRWKRSKIWIFSQCQEIVVACQTELSWVSQNDTFWDRRERYHQGQKVLRDPTGYTETFCNNFLREVVSDWTRQADKLASIANSQPQAAHSAVAHGFLGRWIFTVRTTETFDKFAGPFFFLNLLYNPDWFLL